MTRINLIAPSLPSGRELLAAGRDLAQSCRLGASRYMRETGYPSEAAGKRAAAMERRVTQHAHIGFRNVERTLGAIAEVHEKCAAAGVTVDRFGITLDWSMGYPEAMRKSAPRGTGIVLTGPEDFVRITEASPAAAHFGDFMIGLPGALENTQAALRAGATSIGNLGQYFTFRLPHWDDEVATTVATVKALGLIAAQDAEILVHSNLDDGFAGLFLDMCCSLGMVIVEKYIIEELAGARLGHCYGHHFSDPLSRMAFHSALHQVTDTPGTMIFGNTVSYQSSPAGNYASLANYLLADIMALRRWPTGHAVNPVPVTENSRIPDIDEIIDAQTFASRLREHAPFHETLVEWPKVEAMADELVRNGRRFAGNVLKGLGDLGVDTTDAAQLLLAIRRMGPKRLEDLFGPGGVARDGGQRKPLVLAEWARELDETAKRWIVATKPGLAPVLPKGLKACVATSDVHEHGKYLVEKALSGLDIALVDGGVSVDADRLVAKAVESGADFIAISTYNGVALRFCREVMDQLASRNLKIPIVVGGRLNQVPDDSNSGLPVDVTADLQKLGCHPCTTLDDIVPVLSALGSKVATAATESGSNRRGTHHPI
ncbi:cobalamin-dependent protein [Taklimakanibacter deserti]|uniref:cobalamin-dependent protein n=1 Tax=Taklimakanibacter deserti TaxID=2267839 RepID=UPI0034D54899